MSAFYENPEDAYTGASVNLSNPLPERQCTFTIASGERARGVANLLPEKTEGNLIGIAFDCNAESRKEYFPVIYRQGS